MPLCTAVPCAAPSPCVPVMLVVFWQSTPDDGKSSAACQRSGGVIQTLNFSATSLVNSSGSYAWAVAPAAAYSCVPSNQASAASKFAVQMATPADPIHQTMDSLNTCVAPWQVGFFESGLQGWSCCAPDPLGWWF
eukprot:EG_transcript_28561